MAKKKNEETDNKDGLKEMYESIALPDGSNLVNGALYLSDGMYLLPDGSVVGEEEIW